MKEVVLSPKEFTHLYIHGYVFAGGYLYERVEFYTFVRVMRIREQHLGTKASKDEKSDENPNGWERVKVNVKGGEDDD